jgi:hypothetical protein
MNKVNTKDLPTRPQIWEHDAPQIHPRTQCDEPKNSILQRTLSFFFAFTNGENVSSDIVGAAAKKQGLPKVHMQWCHLVESGPLKSRPPKTKSTREKY